MDERLTQDDINDELDRLDRAATHRDLTRGEKKLRCALQLGSSMNALANRIHTIARDRGWWDDDREFGTLIALCHSELSEALEGARDGDPESDKIDGYSVVEEELADVIIRVLDMAEGLGLDVVGAIRAKTEYNAGREYRHGGREF